MKLGTNKITLKAIKQINKEVVFFIWNFLLLFVIEDNKNKIITELEQLELELRNYQVEELDYKIILNKIERYKSSLEFMDN